MCVIVVKLEFHGTDTDTDTDILARILADTSDTRDFLKLFMWQEERHSDILATILARMSTRMSASVSVSCVGVVECQLNAVSRLVRRRFLIEDSFSRSLV